MLDESKNLGLGVGKCSRHSVIYTVKACGISLVTDLQGFDGGFFLSNPRNTEWRKRYTNVSKQFLNKYQAHRGDFGGFERIFDDIFDRLRQRGQLPEQDALIYTFLHYMYCTCDLGCRMPEEKP